MNGFIELVVTVGRHRFALHDDLGIGHQRGVELPSCDHEHDACEQGQCRRPRGKLCVFHHPYSINVYSMDFENIAFLIELISMYNIVSLSM